ncbi:hypothetical protein ACFLSE_06810 [Bacteroidota bacterium]
MERKDFILREIEKITILIQYLLGKYKPIKSAKEYRTIEKLFNKELKERYGKDLEYILNIEKIDFEKEFMQSKGFNLENIELLADLFQTLGNDQFSESQKYLNKALELYAYVDETSKTFSYERSNKINSLKSIT